MENKTEFYKLLKAAVTDDVALVRVLDKIVKLINKNSRNKHGVIDEDKKARRKCKWKKNHILGNK